MVFGNTTIVEQPHDRQQRKTHSVEDFASMSLVPRHRHRGRPEVQCSGALVEYIPLIKEQHNYHESQLQDRRSNAIENSDPDLSKNENDYFG